jgi:small subunit ribosomal protein S14
MRKGIIEHNKTILKLCKFYFQKRSNLKKQIIQENDIEKKFKLIQKLDSMNRNSSYTRYRLRCMLTGRPNGCNRITGLCRIQARDLLRKCLLPGFKRVGS